MEPQTISTKSLWAGRIMSGLPVLFLLMDGAMKLWRPPVVVEATRQLGFPESQIMGLGVVLLASVLTSLTPRTSVLGAVLLTGYLGGAVASQARINAPVFNLIFAITLGGLLWGGLWLRDQQLRRLLPLRSH
jgi:hypothetical protein